MSDQALSVDSLIGLQLSHYRIIEEIGSGGMGVVFRAHDHHLDREVAIKVLHPGTITDESARKHLHKEALTLSKLNHPNIATIYDFDSQKGIDFLVMEYIPGVTLNQRLAMGSLPEKEVLHLGLQLAEGLSAAHEHGIVHRDLKPGNLRLTSDRRLKILDFGLAKLRRPISESATTECLSETQTIAGTLLYMAPEQVLGSEVDARTDIHATGSVLYEMATGLRPFSAADRSNLISAILHSSPTLATSRNPMISTELARIIAKCLEREPENRYQSAKELAIDLRRLQAGVPSELQSAGRPTKWLSAKAVGLGLGILFLIVFNLGNLRKRVLGGADVPPIESLAVLPLVNLSGDPQQEYFADGMTEELITNLGEVGALRVISRTSVMQYKQTKKTLPTIARELKVDAVVEGSVLLSGKRVRITAQLIQPETEQHLWGERYERDVSDILALQAEVARDIAAGIRGKLAPHQQTRLASTRSVDPAAYDLYLKGRYNWNKRSREGVLRGLEYFEQAVQMDPTYALAYVGVADSYVVLLVFNWRSPAEAIPPAKVAALKALSIDEALAEAHSAMAKIGELDWDWTTAEREYQRALELNPNYATAHLWYSLYLSEMSRHEEAVAEAKRAAEIDPLSLISNTNVGQSLYYARQYDEAQRVLSRVIETDAHFEPAQYCAGEVYVQTGRFNEAIAAFKQAAILSPGDDLVFSALVYVYGRARRKAEAENVLGEWKNLSRQRYVSHYLLAESYVGLGENEKAMQSLEKAYQDRDSLVITMGVDPMLDPLRPDPRFQDLLHRINLSQSGASF